MKVILHTEFPKRCFRGTWIVLTLSWVLLQALSVYFSSKAQELGVSVSGTVVDRTGVVIARAQITATSKDTGRVINAVTDSSGAFTIRGLQPGRYDVEIKVAGFASKKLSDVTLSAGQTQNLTIQMDIGPVLEPSEMPSGEPPPPPTEAPSGEPPPPPKETLPATAPGGEPASANPLASPQKLEEPFWNVWQEEYRAPSPRFKPVKMQADHRYLVVVNLAALAYEHYVAGIYSSKVSKDFDSWLRQNSEDQTTLTVLAIPDERFFEPLVGVERVHQLPIDLKKLQQAYHDGFELPKDPFAVLAEQKDEARFNFGTVSFVVRTKKNVSGNAAIAFSFWDDEKPVTELSYSTCISGGPQNRCSAVPPAKYSLLGVDTNNYHKSPNAALHFVELDAETLIGIFRCNKCGWGPYEFKHWKLGGGANWFKQQFELTVLPGIKLAANGPDDATPTTGTQRPTYSESTFNNAADSLFRLLFPAGPASEAQAAFKGFVARAIAHPPTDGIAPSLFVRLLPQHPDNAFVVPLGLTRVPLDDGTKEFLGFHFRIQTPLELQDYSPQVTCPSKWVLLMPPVNLVDNPLSLARDEFKDWIGVFAKDSSHTTVYADVDTFKDWLAPGPTEDITPDSYAVMILSHHYLNSLFMDQSISSIFAPIIAKTFTNPSIAIIDACGAANPGAFEFVKDFNNHGVYTVIASSVDVDAKMGGDFLKSLVDAINSHPSDETYSIDRAVYDAIQSLRKQSDGSDTSPLPYGPRALVYGLLGNGSVRLCVPPKSNSMSEEEMKSNAASTSVPSDD